MVHDSAALAAETRLLLACARLELTPADARSVEALLAAPLRWELVLAEAGRHGLVPLLHHHRERLPLPPAVRAGLERSFERNAARALVLTAELVAQETSNVSAGRDDLNRTLQLSRVGVVLLSVLGGVAADQVAEQQRR